LSFPTSCWFFATADPESLIVSRKHGRTATVKNRVDKSRKCANLPHKRVRQASFLRCSAWTAALRLDSGGGWTRFFAGVKITLGPVNMSGLGGCKMSRKNARYKMNKFHANSDFFMCKLNKSRPVVYI
jgi:hypothetical protein